jgi:serine/threonine-protein kinase CTR1
MIWGGKPVAIKVLSLASHPTKSIRAFAREAAINNLFDSPNVVKQHGIGFYGSNAYMVMELACGGVYLQDIKTKAVANDGTFPSKHHLELYLDVARGMEHVHANGIIHRDIYVSNLLEFDAEPASGRSKCYKVSDFGQSKEQDDPVSIARGTCRRYAPEALENKNGGPLYYKFASDVFMFGMLMWELAEATLPWPELETGPAATKTTKGERPKLVIGHRPNCTINPQFSALLDECWHQDPTKRPTFTEIVQRLTMLIK